MKTETIEAAIALLETGDNLPADQLQAIVDTAHNYIGSITAAMPRMTKAERSEARKIRQALRLKISNLTLAYYAAIR
jgi:hypothetical protein